MNNIKYYSDNLAHDFDMFMPKIKAQPKDKQNNVIEMPAKTANQTKKAVSLKSKIFPIMMSVFIAASIFGNIYIRAEISKVGNELNSAEVIAEQLKSEQTRLSVELEKKTSIGNLEKQAKNLGMQKQEKSQINYIFSYSEQDIEESADVE